LLKLLGVCNLLLSKAPGGPNLFTRSLLSIKNLLPSSRLGFENYFSSLIFLEKSCLFSNYSFVATNVLVVDLLALYSNVYLFSDGVAEILEVCSANGSCFLGFGLRLGS
jgi:hypothetical protein